MSYEEPLSKQAIAISISETLDMNVLGLAKEHLVDAMAEVARYLLAMGARLIYGGDLRPGGFTEVLFELVTRYHRDADIGDNRVAISDFLAWPVHISLSREELEKRSDSLKGVAEIICLTLEGKRLTPENRNQLVSRNATENEWAFGLTSMREVMMTSSDARIVLGGKVEGFKGGMPGVAEESLLALRSGQPLFILGGFGGCARDIAEDLGMPSRHPSKESRWPGRESFQAFNSQSLNNRLNEEENATLATTVHVDEAVALILRGLLRKERLDPNKK